MQCPHFDAGRCRSCTLMGVPYAQQAASKDAAVREALAEVTDEHTAWEPVVCGPESGFRNKAKLVATGTAARPRLGILDPAQHPRHHDGTGVDLRDCGLYEPGMEAAFHAAARAISTAGLEPYDVATRTGELKHVHVTISPDRELMVRFVLRSRDRLEALRAAVPGLCDELAALGTPAAVVSANLLPRHVALPEGEEEIVLAGGPTLTMRLNGIGLRLRPQGFFQTNTAVTRRLYAEAAGWLAPLGARRAWDLFCGVGGFAFHVARDVADGGAGVREVFGLETSAEAVAAARQSAEELGLTGRARFVAGDAGALIDEALAATGGAPDAVVVNPPRRGVGAELTTWLDASGVPTVLYSSCHAGSLARDLAAMPSYRVARVRVFDMFPQTGHAETLVLLRRR